MPDEKNNLRARFYTDPVQGDVVEVKIAGDPFQSSSLQKVTADHVRQFPREWEAYQQGKPTIDHGGTPLTEVPGFHPSMTTALALSGVHNAEQLASLSDGNLSVIGIGGRGLREAAKNLLDGKAKDTEIDRLKQQIADQDREKADREAVAQADAARVAREKADADAKTAPKGKAA